MIENINEFLSGLNHLGTTFCRYAAGAFLQSALLVIVLLGIDLFLRKRVRAVVRYCIWLLVLVKLILPPTLSLPTGIGYWGPGRVPTVALVSEPPEPVIGFEQMTREVPPHTQPADVPTPVALIEVKPVESDSVIEPVPVSQIPITWQTAFLLFWLVGMLAFVVLLIQRIRFVRGLVATSTAAEGPLLVSLEECCRQIRLRGRVALRTSDALPSPAVCGLWRPTILMPASLVTKLSPDGLKATLIHELAHIKRADLWINAVQTVLQVVHFYNPFVWLANAIIRRTCEEAVDETVLVALGGQVKDYSNTLISISEMGFWKADFGLRLIGVAESKRALKRRIKHMLTRPVPQSSKIGAFSTIGIILIAAVLLPMARGERSGQDTPTPSSTAITEASETNSSTEANDVIVDPNRGVKFVVAKTITGANNQIAFVKRLIMSPDARFLVLGGRVVPVDGSETFSYTEPERSSDVRDAAISPNGRYIVHGKNTIWLQPVSPETLRPNGPAKKLLDLGGGSLATGWKPFRWTRDSKVVFFKVHNKERRLQNYAFSAATGDSVSYPDSSSMGLTSPDGKCIALTDTRGFWVKPIGDDAARVLCESGSPPAPECWSRDGKWLIGTQLLTQPDVWGQFVSYPDGQEYHVPLPKELWKDNNTTCLGVSADREKLYYYQAGYDLTYGVWVASAEDTALNNMEVGWFYGYGGYQWAQNGKAIIHNDARYSYTKNFTGRYGDRIFFSSTLSGEKTTPLTLPPIVSTGKQFSLSPDNKWLRFTAARESGRSKVDLSMIPLSIADHEAIGPTTVLLSMASTDWVSAAWSPDSTRVAVACKTDSVKEQDIWITFVDGRKPIRLTRTVADEWNLQWSPDGNMLAYISNDEVTAELKVIPTAGGEAVMLRRRALANAEKPLWVWSPDSKSLTIAEEGMLVRQPLSSGQGEPILNLKKFGIEDLKWFDWSPDGSQLALANYTRDTRSKKGVLDSWGQLLFARVEEGRLQKTGVTDLGTALWAGMYAWSPDSRHVACGYEGLVPVGPGGRLYTVAVDNIVERIEAGAIPPIGPKLAEPAPVGTSPESKLTPKPDPIRGSVFSDNFDSGLSKYWQIVPGNPEASPPPAHAVENGQLMLTNSIAQLSQIDWADYRVTVRVCVKEGGDSERGIAAIQTRAIPFEFDVNKMERYALLFICSNNASASLLRLALYHHLASGASRGPTLGRDPCPLVQGKWYKLAFEVRGEQLRAYLDDKLVIETTDARLSKGSLLISASESPVLFDDFSVRQLP